MKEFTFGFKLAAVLSNSFSTSFQQAQRNISNTKQEVNVPPPIEAEASCFSENSTTNSEEL